MKRLFTLSLLVGALNLAYAQSTEVTQSTKQATLSLQVKCQKLKVAKDACVIVHFKFTDEGNSSAVKKPADMYRVLNGQNATRQYVATDYFKNGQQQSSTFATSNAQALLTSPSLTDLAVTQKNYMFWNEAGQKTQEIAELKDGLAQSLITNFYDNGQKSSESHYKNGMLNGAETEWGDNGQKHSEINYTDGVLDGEFSIWHKNGKLDQVGYYIQGKADGKWLKFYENGQLELEQHYQNDELRSSTSYYENGQKKLEGAGFSAFGLLEGKSTA